MPIRVLCRCKHFMILPDKYAGQHVQCPDCRTMVRIPAADEDRALVRWRCECGQRLKARPRMAGRAFTCPNCKARSVVPVPAAVDHFIGEKFTRDSGSDVVGLSPPGENGPASSEASPDAPTGPIAELDEDKTSADDDAGLEVPKHDPAKGLGESDVPGGGPQKE